MDSDQQKHEYQTNDAIMKQQRGFQDELESKQFIIDESKQQIMNQAAQIDNMQQRIEQLQNENNEQQNNIKSFKEQLDGANSQFVPQSMFVNQEWPQRTDMNQRSQSIEKSNKKISDLNREIE